MKLVGLPVLSNYTFYLNTLHDFLPSRPDVCFLCMCLQNVAGKFSCSSDPCQNGGECVDDVVNNTYNCTCKQPFYGDNCESE